MWRRQERPFQWEMREVKDQRAAVSLEMQGPSWKLFTGMAHLLQPLSCFASANTVVAESWEAFLTSWAAIPSSLAVSLDSAL